MQIHLQCFEAFTEDLSDIQTVTTFIIDLRNISFKANKQVNYFGRVSFV